jgi:Family of unknown function (DUF5755)
MPRRCPPGMVCFPDTFSIFSLPSATLMVIFIVAVGLVAWSLHTQQPQIMVTPSVLAQPQVQPQQAPVEVNVKSGDDRYSRAPEAERDWIAGPDLSRVPSTPFNIPTQGIPESYQSMGIVKTSDGKLLPLYGRRSISSRDRYNYYTRTDSYNPIPIPVQMKGRDCQDQVGCPELYDGDRVKLSATNETGEVTIYRVRDIVR